MMNDKKKALNLILGPEKKEEVKEASPSDLRMAMESFLSCVANHDVEGCMSSLKACILACDSEGYESEEG
jgi:hypothetical protein